MCVANLLDHGDVPDEELMDLEGNLTTTAVLGLRRFLGGPADALANALVGPLLSAFLHASVNFGARVAEWTRAPGGSSNPDYKGLLTLVDRNGIRGDRGTELGNAKAAACRAWTGTQEGSRVRGREDMDEEESIRPDSRFRRY